MKSKIAFIITMSLILALFITTVVLSILGLQSIGMYLLIPLVILLPLAVVFKKIIDDKE